MTKVRTATVSKSLPLWALAIAVALISLVVILPR
jgi:hypothetical protein